jgi:hypothetical protein
MSQYPYPQHVCKTPLDLDLYPFVEKKVEECMCKVLGRG